MINTTTEITAGMKVYLVGGAVRDILLGKTPKDRDYVVVGQTVESMLDAGFKQVGKDFPVFLHPTTGEEYALARTERKTGDGYHGFETVTDGVTLEADLMRRDFTINSMAMTLDGTQLIDPFGGKLDLMEGIIRHTSDAFSEDPLRVIRLARFAARYGFGIALETIELCAEIVERGDLEHISRERFWIETEKALRDEDPAMFFSILKELDVFYHVRFFRKLCPLVSNVFALKACACATRAVQPIDRLDFFIGMMGYYIDINEDDSWFPSARSVKLYETMQFVEQTFFSMNPVTAQLYELLNRLNVTREGTLFDDFCKMLKVFPQESYRMSELAYNLDRGAKIVRSVKAADFPEFTGKELGEKIAKTRFELLKSVL